MSWIWPKTIRKRWLTCELLVATDRDPIRVQELDEWALDIANTIGMKPLIRCILSRCEILKA
jgi:hypothetical protein